MLAASQSLYASGTLFIKVGGTAGRPQVQQMRVRQGCPLSPTLFGLFFDGLHEHLSGPSEAVKLCKSLHKILEAKQCLMTCLGGQMIAHRQEGYS